MKIRVDEAHWVNGGGYSHTETIDHITVGVGDDINEIMKEYSHDYYIEGILYNKDNGIEEDFSEDEYLKFFDEDDNLICRGPWRSTVAEEILGDTDND